MISGRSSTSSTPPPARRPSSASVRGADPQGHDLGRSVTLKKLAEPFILRRVKTDRRIIDDLPDKIEQKMYSHADARAGLYEAVVKDVERKIEELDGMERRGLILATLMRLKQICNHPAQFLADGSAFTPSAPTSSSVSARWRRS